MREAAVKCGALYAFKINSEYIRSTGLTKYQEFCSMSTAIEHLNSEQQATTCTQGVVVREGAL